MATSTNQKGFGKMSDITLSAGVRQNLLSLQNTADMMSTTQNRLATGKKVNSALDNPSNFFTSQSLGTRANELSNLLDNISTSTQVLEAADNGIKAITDLVESAQSTVKQAQSANSSSEGTHIQGDGSIDTTSSPSGTTVKERVEAQTLSNLGIDSAADITLTSTSENGVTSTFNLAEHFTATGEALDDANGDTTTGDAYSVSDLVNDINASGVATASITDDGRLDLKANGNEKLDLTLQSIGGASQAASDSVAAVFGFGGSADVDGEGATVTGAGGTDVEFTNGASAGAADTFTVSNVASSTDSDNADLVTQFNEILDQIDQLAADSSFNGQNLINGLGNDLTVAFNEKRDEGKSELTIASADLTSSGLNLSDATSLSSDEANEKLDALSESLSTLRTQGSTFGSNLNTVKIRQDFTKDSINTLQTGADSLVLADTNEEGANMLALQTRQSLSTTALSLASSADQAVLSFLR
ncbi:flagellin [Cohaesibacter celericrescens]|uniref:Flagellin n=4 Tax=Cohaesibacter celericrescens TaxID=2067669 RepID=A0A2N5XWH0_9HYPH|nr:flagellin [Cohaesibacter celericrescens]